MDTWLEVEKITEHPALSLVPLMRPDEYRDFLADVQARGIQVPLEIMADGTLLDGRHRLKAAKELGLPVVPYRTVETADPEGYVLKAAVLRRHLTDDQRAMLAAKWAQQVKRQGKRADSTSGLRGPEVEDKGAREKAAEKLNVKQKKVKEATQVLHAAPQVAEKVASGEVKLKDAMRQVKKAKREEALAELVANLPEVTERYRLICGRFQEAQLEPDSIDVILVDPPYAVEFLPEWEALGKFAARILKPGGSLVAMSGRGNITEVLTYLASNLSYHWIIAYLTPGGQSPQIWDKRVNSFWKPVLWFVKGDYAGPWLSDVATSAVNDNDKEHHAWGQSESGFADLVEKFSKPGDLVCDPMMGAGTTGIVCLRLNRRFLGIDCDPAAFEETKRRLAEEFA